MILDGIMHVMQTAFDPAYGEAWNRRQVADALVLPSTHALLVDAQGQIITDAQRDPAGFVLSRHAADEEELLLIAVLPQHRGCGLGGKLMDRFFEAAAARGIARIFLEMRRNNTAIRLYQKAGFEPIGERRNYYRAADGSRIDAITFTRTI
jgi:ribosomal-protein-alanine N-acetyltransferase